MKAFVIGGGGRGHVVVWSLCKSPKVTELWCTPGNAGMAEETLLDGSKVHTLDVAATDLIALLEAARKIRPDLIVVLSEDPLALGAVDLFTKEGFVTSGPTQRASRFEWSKAYCQRFMQKWNIPCARGESFTEAGAAIEFAYDLGGACAVKNDELSLGKGVDICHDFRQAETSIEKKFAEKPGRRLVIQELLTGTEASLHIACNGKEVAAFPSSEDYKRSHHGDTGEMTGGMGAYSPSPFMDEALMDRAHREIIAPWLMGCADEKIDFRGILYPGVMITEDGPKLLEMNARFGDPETQIYLTRLENDLYDLLHACAVGDPIPELRWENEAAASVCVILASHGYPIQKSASQVITGLEAVRGMEGVKVFHDATVKTADGRMMTNGGRVLGVTAWARHLMTARRRAYDAAECIRFTGMHMRPDIAEKAVEYISRIARVGSNAKSYA
ncbi:MAG: phosphoribosylamine---glycine ligase [Candidatus Parcubacteria bacterium]|nr:phosphoribosylamine---glycine ligase [Candidatus Parcubacteria bacterium]